uniref:BPTI/Kunitz inhibitor domain-containing protein n=1 Tax=Timema tahoe TaxID=61484 RepID=A0A7R9IFY7_9NEOP|nr:unnamed protein product [Timema tahoe]
MIPLINSLYVSIPVNPALYQIPPASTLGTISFKTLTETYCMRLARLVITGERQDSQCVIWRRVDVNKACASEGHCNKVKGFQASQYRPQYTCNLWKADRQPALEYTMTTHHNSLLIDVPVLEVSSCKFQKESGHCLGFNERYYYNLETMSCKEFIYGGCQGNCNRYSSYKKCMKACHGCKLQKEKGICKAHFERYYYDLETMSCKKFIYGGCKGNCNRYYSYKQCMKACHARRHCWDKSRPTLRGTSRHRILFQWNFDVPTLHARSSLRFGLHIFPISEIKDVSSPEQDSNINLSVLDCLAQHETSALANYATEAATSTLQVQMRFDQ